MLNYRSADPQVAADVANAIAQSYVDHTANIQVKASGSPSDFMEKQRADLRTKMERSSLALADFERRLDANQLASRLQQLNTQYTAARSERLVNDTAYGSAATISSLQDRVNQAKQRLNDASSGQNYDEQQKAKKELADAQGAEMDYQVAANREDRLHTAVSAAQSEYDGVVSQSIKYQQLKHVAEADKALYDDLERRMQDAGIDAGFRNNWIRIVDPAKPPDSAAYPETRLSLLLVSIASLLAAIGGTILIHQLTSTARKPRRIIDVAARRVG